MLNSNLIRERYPQCEIVEAPTEFTHRLKEKTNFYCAGIQQGRKPDGTLESGDKVAIRSMDDKFRPWIITSQGVVAQIEGELEEL
ncbi:hypothetical protein SAMN05444008_10969 [Cnuella takakiae]|uniref:Uncharacterized protein n=1 Tax=Cnuella takakiae TaxID=1302690 RepID=A0A1M5CGU4_9BACT|nr:hypothetical protein [Cnuella takakiae]OLY91819.1 hypothetical protein BUE76_07840 [Cnuella takakiae]SHF53975.1 hypothetical protein SAMN05444008_10969 [Cnuella takakiae]